MNRIQSKIQPPRQPRLVKSTPAPLSIIHARCRDRTKNRLLPKARRSLSAYRTPPPPECRAATGRRDAAAASFREGGDRTGRLSSRGGWWLQLQVVCRVFDFSNGGGGEEERTRRLGFERETRFTRRKNGGVLKPLTAWACEPSRDGPGLWPRRRRVGRAGRVVV
jgi:hypothetical protein